MAHLALRCVIPLGIIASSCNKVSLNHNDTGLSSIYFGSLPERINKQKSLLRIESAEQNKLITYSIADIEAKGSTIKIEPGEYFFDVELFGKNEELLATTKRNNPKCDSIKENIVLRPEPFKISLVACDINESADFNTDDSNQAGANPEKRELKILDANVVLAELQEAYLEWRDRGTTTKIDGLKLKYTKGMQVRIKTTVHGTVGNFFFRSLRYPNIVSPEEQASISFINNYRVDTSMPLVKEGKTYVVDGELQITPVTCTQSIQCVLSVVFNSVTEVSP